jgi:hypothetical protein
MSSPEQMEQIPDKAAVPHHDGLASQLFLELDNAKAQLAGDHNGTFRPSQLQAINTSAPLVEAKVLPSLMLTHGSAGGDFNAVGLHQPT